jgi:uncharacterized RDD family membrane protein YckC
MRPDSLAGLCPACLLTAASEPVSDITGALTTLTPLGGSRASSAGPGASTRLAPGQDFGPYRIVRLLGQGGMGEVYEAEQIEHGRRVALKVLSQRLIDRHDRARFLREGQLAASINHPHSVYIFGSEEIAGTPVIAMELLAGGTLKDRVREQGPLPPAEAVDAIRQVIAGLDAAQAGGILHRDVKPANCFTDRDGTVKVGDFGLSISTMARDVTDLTTSGTFQGTPAFAAPEQLKGDPLDLRADIYAVGATLYYLLTGQPPFDDTDLMALVTRIATEAPRSPRALQPRVPRGLATIVLRCLAKDRESRPATYAALDEALRPFGPAAATPGTFGRRSLAGLIDLALLLLTVVPLRSYADYFGTTTLRTSVDVGGLLVAIVYFAVLDGWGGSLGKRACGLRVTGPDGQRPGLLRACLRALIFAAPILADSFSYVFQELSLTAIPLFLLMFSAARRRNGFAGLHELVSRTRVVERDQGDARAQVHIASGPPPAVPAHTRRFPPYDVVGSLGATDQGELIEGFDPALQRKVWIHALAPGAAPVSPQGRDLSRPGRLRWLSGRRTETDCWDAYDALDGAPLVRVAERPQPWRIVKRWLLELAQEIEAGLAAGSLPALAIDRVWITRTAGAKLLEFRPPGVAATSAAEVTAPYDSSQVFLAAVARYAQNGQASHGPLPLPASRTLDELSRHALAGPREVSARISSLNRTVDDVGRSRVSHLAMTVVPVVLLALFSLATAPPLDVQKLEVALGEFAEQTKDALIQTPLDPAQEEAVEVYIAGRFGTMIAEPRSWRTAGESPRPSTAPYGLPERDRPTARRVLAAHPRVSPDDLAATSAAVTPFREAFETYATYHATEGFPADYRQLEFFLRQLATQEELRRPAALAVFIAGRYGSMIADARTWTNPETGRLLAPWRPIAMRVLGRHPRVSAAQLRAATEELTTYLERVGTTATPADETDFAGLRRHLSALDEYEFWTFIRTPLDAQRRQTLQRYVAGRFRAVIEDSRGWPRRPGSEKSSFDELQFVRVIAQQALIEHPDVTPQELAAAATSLEPLLAVYDEYATSSLSKVYENYPKDFRILLFCAQHLLARDELPARRWFFDPTQPSRAALETYIAGHFGPLIADERTWTNQIGLMKLPALREAARQIVARHPRVPSADVVASAATVEPFLDAHVVVGGMQVPAYLSVAAFGPFARMHRSARAGVALTLLLGLLSAAAVGGGVLLRAFGIAVVTANGKPASRLRAFWRALVAWSPLFAAMWLPLGVSARHAAGDSVVVLFLAGVAWAVTHPTRGVQDRLAGTWLVPR